MLKRTIDGAWVLKVGHKEERDIPLRAVDMNTERPMVMDVLE